MSNLNRPVVNFKKTYYQRSGSQIVVTPPAIPIVDRYLDKITIGVTLPPDLHRLLIVSAQQMDITGCLNALMNGLEVHIDRTDGNPTMLADLKIAQAGLMGWKVAIAWCLRDYLKYPKVNEYPYNRKDYRALMSHGGYVYAKFELIEALFKAFDLIDVPNPWRCTFLEGFTMAMLEEINRSVQAREPSTKQVLATTRKEIASHRQIANRRQKVTPYPDSTDWRVNHDLFVAIQTIVIPQPSDNNTVKKARSAVKRKYKAFIAAMEDWAKDIQEDPQKAFSHAITDEKTGQVYVIQKREKGRSGRKRMTNIPEDKKKQ
ncbi:MULTISPECIES: hypothetical protein [Leptolyngbya]|uniref:hypothetical protein n=1 Tax=Leptolyngbya TaxID=47251 RepID=UPI0016825AE0|nr:hypothetical protein [Leptolyngbya sp. FACHB-1624]MBD1859284.1 hypothetical protein [Leptolyngbya sp. FACHB-1624]